MKGRLARPFFFGLRGRHRQGRHIDVTISAMTTPAPIDGPTRAAIDAFLNRLAPRFATREAILSGSRARGNARPDSDADLAIILRGGPKPFMHTKLDMVDIAFDAMLETGIRVQPLPIWETDRREPNQCFNPDLLRHIELAGIRVWQTPTG